MLWRLTYTVIPVVLVTLIAYIMWAVPYPITYIHGKLGDTIYAGGDSR